MKQYTVAVVGATGLIGEELIAILEQRDFPIQELHLFDTEGLAGNKLSHKGAEVVVEKLTDSVFHEIDLAFFATTADVSQAFVPKAVKSGTIVIDLSSAFRLEPNVPLVVPEINPHLVSTHHGIIASPGSMAIPLALTLHPIHVRARLKRLVISTYQAVSENGMEAIEELDRQVRHIFNQKDILCQAYPHQIAFNCLPHVGNFTEDDNTEAEELIRKELQKIFDSEDLGISVSAVRVPVFHGHSATVNIETEKGVYATEVGFYLDEAPGLKVLDEPDENLYPLPIEAVGEDEVLVGRIREDESVENGLNLWVVTDNLKKGGALNAVQIAEVLVWNG
jgi:aspartate-semialdehyde dehydrogenase